MNAILESPVRPPWERFGAERPAEPHQGGLSYRDALAAWGDPSLQTMWAGARRSSAEADEALKAAEAELRAHYAARRTRYGSSVMYPRLDPRSPQDRHVAAQAAISPSRAASTAARQAVEADFKKRWVAGEFIAYGIRSGIPMLVPSSLCYRLDLWNVPPHGRMLHEPDIDQVRFYRVADHSQLVAALAEAEPTPSIERVASENRPPAGRKADPRKKSDEMIAGLEKALASSSLVERTPATLKAAYKAMLDAMEIKEVRPGMGYDAFCKHCKLWLKMHGIYG
jgi:hypothetical protein